jgi:hypothetical protein
MVGQRIFVPSRGAADWQRLLAEPDKQWRTGYSARTLAECWQDHNGLPPEIAVFFPQEPALLLAIPEYKVPLPGGRRESQSDVFALVRFGEKVSAVMVEGKVDEPFGPTLGEWLDKASDGKRIRLTYICERLGLKAPPDPSIRYQLLHRTAAAVIEAERFNTAEAAMIVHSFSRTRAWNADFDAFCELFTATWEGAARLVTLPDGRKLRLGWAQGEERYLHM